MNRLTRRTRDRGDVHRTVRMPLTTAQTQRYTYGAMGAPGAGAISALRDGKTLVRFSWAGGTARSISVVASFDGFMHHRMQRIALGQRSGPATYEIALRISPGTYTYKFLVDGVWRTDANCTLHPIQRLADGTMAHTLVVKEPPHEDEYQQQQQHQSQYAPQLVSAAASPGAARVTRPRSRAPVRSSSVSDLHRAANFSHDGRVGTSGPTGRGGMHTHALGIELGSQRSFTHLHSQQRERVQREQREHQAAVAAAAADRQDRPSSFMAMAPSPTQRKSLLPRLHSGWMRRLSGRHASNVSEAIENEAAPEKENAASLANPSPAPASFDSSRSNLTPRKWRPGLRASGRSAPVTISKPIEVDRPADIDEVTQTANEWRNMAMHLQNDLSDPAGARVLLQKAVNHREMHGLFNTVQNAQTHVDLARNLSKANLLIDAERHLRMALRIYQRVNSGPEHIGDLLHYIGVVVDRQKRRDDAEILYRQALKVYWDNRIRGNNVDIAVKNLALNLKKQGREQEAERMVGQYHTGAHSQHVQHQSQVVVT